MSVNANKPSDHSSSDLLIVLGVTLNFTETWGDAHYLGLTGLELVSKDGEAIPITLDMMHAEPRDLHILPGYETDDRTLDKYVSPMHSQVSIGYTASYGINKCL